jgi:hypothetical protein
MHPLGLFLTDFFHPKKQTDDNVVCLPDELVRTLDPRLTKDAYVRRTTEMQTTPIEQCLNSWFATPNASETDLTKLMTTCMNSLLNGDRLYAKHQAHFKRPVDENGEKQSAYTDILVNRKIGTKQDNRDPASLLIEVGLARYHPMTKADQVISYLKILCNKGLLMEPMLMAVVRVLPHKPASSFPGAQIAVFLVIPRQRVGFRVSLLWRGAPPTAKDMANDFARLMCVTEYVAEWNYINPQVDSFQYLGPHCCRIGGEVGVDHTQCAPRWI